MIRHRLAYIAAAALAGFAVPAIAEDGPPPAPSASRAGGWVDPQVQYPGSWTAGAPVNQPPPPGSYPVTSLPYPPATPPGAPMPYAHGPMPAPAYPGAPLPPPPPGAYAAGPCGCAAYGYGYPMMWVPVQFQTHVIYSAPLRHEREVVEEHTVQERVVETKVVPLSRTKYVKTAPATKITKKVQRTTK